MTKFDTAVSAYTHHVSKVDLLCTFPPTAGTASPLGKRLDSLKVSNQIFAKLCPFCQTNQRRFWYMFAFMKGKPDIDPFGH